MYFLRLAPYTPTQSFRFSDPTATIMLRKVLAFAAAALCASTASGRYKRVVDLAPYIQTSPRRHLQMR